METSLLQEWMASFHILSINAIIIYILKGTLFTVIISAIAVFLGVIFGSILALVRNYCNAPKYRVFKYLANVATVELMSRVRQILSSANMYNGIGNINVSDVFVLYGCAAIIYFIINFSLSLFVRHLNAKKSKIKITAVKA